MDLIEIRDIEKLESEIEKTLEIEWMRDKAMNYEVTCEDTAKHALSMALQSRKLEKTLEQSRTEIIKPHLDYQRAVNKLVKDFQAKLDNMEKSLQAKIEVWMNEQKENPFATVEEIRVDDGMIYTQKYWDFEIENPHLVPNNYKTIVDSLIEKDIKNGVRNIPGVKIIEKEKTMMRIKN